MAPQVQQLLPTTVSSTSWYDSIRTKAIKATKPQLHMLKNANVLTNKAGVVSLLTAHAAAGLARHHGAEQLIVDQLTKVSTLPAWVPQTPQPQVSSCLSGHIFLVRSQPSCQVATYQVTALYLGEQPLMLARSQLVHQGCTPLVRSYPCT